MTTDQQRYAEAPCGDLWNLMPSDGRINRHQKRDRLPSQAALVGARPRIVAWWQKAWLENPALGARFLREVPAALPVDVVAEMEKLLDPGDIFATFEWRRLRLRQDQQVLERLHPRALATHVRAATR